MTARVIKPFDGVPDGQIYPKHFEIGDVIDGDLADVAMREGWAEVSDDIEEKSIGDAPENKRRKK